MTLNEFETGMTNLMQARIGWAKAEAYAHDVVEWMARQGLEVGRGKGGDGDGTDPQPREQEARQGRGRAAS
jgi:hypothetical protein